MQSTVTSGLESGGLKRIDLPGSQVTDGGLAHLAGMQNLEELNLASTRVTVEGVSQLRTLPRLRNIWLSTEQIKAGGGTTKAIDILASLELVRVDYGPDGLGGSHRTPYADDNAE